jgi:hypothetical protein
MRPLKAPFHRREYPNSANPECLPEGRAPKDRGLPSPHPGCATTPEMVWRFFGS